MEQSVKSIAKDRYLNTPLASFPFDLQARLIDATSVHDVYEIGIAILARIPATTAVRIFQRDDRSQFVLVHAWQSPMAMSPAVTATELGQAVHQRWIAAHRVGRDATDFARPFIYEDHPSWLIVPMLAGDELIGAIAAERRDGETFTYAPEDVVALTSAAAGMSWALQAIFLRDRSDVDSYEGRDAIIEEQRREIGRELHDNVVQNLAYLNMKIEIIDRYVVENPEVAREELVAAREVLDRSITELRRTIGEMRRPAPSRRGITGQLRSIASNIEIEASEFEMNLNQISGVQLVPEVEKAVVGIVREALQNVRKHANANMVRLEVYRSQDELFVLITDDGKGIIDPLAPSPEGHFGMDQMRELAVDLGGELRIDSSANGGTRIEARLPLVMPALASTHAHGSGLSASEYLPESAADVAANLAAPVNSTSRDS